MGHVALTDTVFSLTCLTSEAEQPDVILQDWSSGLSLVSAEYRKEYEQDQGVWGCGSL